MEILECGEGDVVLIDEDIILCVVEITDEKVCVKIEIPEEVGVGVEEAHDFAI